MKKTALLSMAVLVLCAIVFESCAMGPKLYGAKTAPDFEYTVDKKNAPENVKPFMTLFEGKWGGDGPEWKLVITRIREGNATLIYSWSSYYLLRGGKMKEGTSTVENAKFDVKKMEIIMPSDVTQYIMLKNDNGNIKIEGRVVIGTFVNYIIMRPVMPVIIEKQAQ